VTSSEVPTKKTSESIYTCPEGTEHPYLVVSVLPGSARWQLRWGAGV